MKPPSGFIDLPLLKAGVGDRELVPARRPEGARGGAGGD
jgi:hypothetical protein